MFTRVNEPRKMVQRAATLQQLVNSTEVKTHTRTVEYERDNIFDKHQSVVKRKETANTKFSKRNRRYALILSYG